MNKTITHYKKTNTRLKNDYHGKRTISKDEATAHGLFESRKTAGCVKPLAVFSENSLKKPCKIEKMSKNQGRNH